MINALQALPLRQRDCIAVVRAVIAFVALIALVPLLKHNRPQR